jgi:hypothetical protein
MSLVKNAYVVKAWSAANRTDPNGNFVNIEGRAGGLVSWLLNLLGISPTAWLKVRGDRIIFHEASLEGTSSFVTPMENICSMFYGYKRPLNEAVLLGVVLGVATFFLLGIPGILIALLYYFLNKRLTIGFTDLGGRVSQMAFKRSIIEGKVIDENAAAAVCEILQGLVDARREAALNMNGARRAEPAAVEPDRPISMSQALISSAAQLHCKSCNHPLEAGATFCDECGTKVD